MRKDKYTLPQPSSNPRMMTFNELKAKKINLTSASQFPHHHYPSQLNGQLPDLRSSEETMKDLEMNDDLVCPSLAQLACPEVAIKSLHSNHLFNAPIQSFSPSVMTKTNNINNNRGLGHKIHLPLSNGTYNSLPPSNSPPDLPVPSSDPSVTKRPIVEPEDDTKSALKEMFLPVMLSGFGNMGAGMVLERVQFMDIFMALPQLIQLVPPLLGLKGNVEMTLASRLSTHANLGHLSDKPTRRRIVIGNIALCQFLATGVGFIAPIIALVLSHLQLTTSRSDSVQIPAPINDHLSATSLVGSSASSMVQFDIDHNNDFSSPALTKALLVVAIFLATSGLADVILSSTITMVVIFSSQVLHVNADNVATPIAASVGDLMTMCFLVYVSKGLYKLSMLSPWAPLAPLALWTVIVICTGIIARRNSFTRSKVFHGWSPLVVSMLLQNISGVVMEVSLRRFPRMAVYQPIINGFGGNLVAIQSSRVATYLQKHAPKKELVNESDSCCHSPFFFFFGDGQHGKLAFLMVLLAGPIQLPLVLISTLLSPTSEITIAQLLTYYVCATVQVIIILYIGYCFVNLLWIFGANPDDNAIPILTALADLLGTLVLVFGYMFLASIGDKNALHLDDENVISPRSISQIVYNATSLVATNLINNGTSLMTSTIAPTTATPIIISTTTTTPSPISTAANIAITTISSLLTSTRRPLYT